MNEGMKKTVSCYILVAMLLFQWIIVASCDVRPLIEPPNELITKLTITPARVVQGQEIRIEMLVWNHTKQEIRLDCDCCWRFQVYTGDMQELYMMWPCPTVVCLGLRFMPDEQMRYPNRFPTRALYESWPSDSGNLAAGKYIVRAGYGDLSKDDNPCPWAQAVFWVVKKK